MRRTPGAGHDHLQAALPGALGIGREALWRTMRRDDSDLVRNSEMLQDFNGMAHGAPIGLAAHDDADQCCAFALRHAADPRPERGGIIGAQDPSAMNIARTDNRPRAGFKTVLTSAP